MPSMNGLQFDPETLLAYIRRHIDTCVDTSNSSFPPLDPALDKPRWMSDNPLGAVINIQINTMRWLRLKPRSIYADQGLVVCSRAEPRLWIFTTAHGKPAAYHPVTGNRMFGISDDGSGWVLFTRGADRATQLVDWVENFRGARYRCWC